MYTTDNAGHIYGNVLMKMWVWMAVRWYYGQSETFIKSRQVTISSFPVEVQIMDYVTIGNNTVRLLSGPNDNRILQAVTKVRHVMDC